ncbi:MAG: EamA family transporter [Hyphomicrobiaceae bacterium]
MTLRDLILTVLVPVIWGTSFCLAKPATEHFPQLFMLAVMYALLAVVYTPFMREPVRTPFWTMAGLAAVAGSIQSILLFTGLSGIDASFAVLVLQIQVPFAVIASRLVVGERIPWLRALGILIAFGGIVTVLGLPAVTPPLLYAGLIVVATLVWAFGQALLKRFGRDGAMRLIQLVAVHAAPQLAIASLFLESGQIRSLQTAGALEWGSAAILMIGGYTIGNSLWYYVMKRARMDQVAPFLLLMPIVGVMVSALVLGDRITMAHVVGGTILLAGLAIVVMVKGEPGESAAPPAGERPATGPVRSTS